jgi:hypothetical protein
MNSTNYIVELLISGICTFLWIALIGLSLWGDDLSQINLQDDKWLITVIVLPVVYIFGIIMDRLSDELFDWLFPLREKHFNSIDEHRIALSTVYVKAPNLIKLYEYGRMRTRIFRNWVVNGLLILLSLLVFCWTSDFIESQTNRWQITVLSILILGGSVVASGFAWYRMNKKEFMFLELQSKLLEGKQP